MPEKEEEREMTRDQIAELLRDMGFNEAQAGEGGMRDIPMWAYDLAETLARAGWVKP